MNKSHCLQYTTHKAFSKQLLRDKIRQMDHKSKKYDSLSYEIDDQKHINAIVPYQGKERKISKKQAKNNSPARISRSKSAKSKKNDTIITTQSSNKNIGDLYYQLMVVKSQYKNLKSSYSKLMQEKTQLSVREQTERAETNGQLQKCKRQLQKHKRLIKQLQTQIDRIKRQCYKIMEMQKFKNKKLEEIIQEKDLMIAYLRNQLQRGKKGNESVISTCANQSNLSFLQNSSPIFSYDYAFKSTSIPVMNNVIIEQNPIAKCKKNQSISYNDDSLSFSNDKSKEIDSFHSFLTNNEGNLRNMTKKDIVIINSSDEKRQNIMEECLTFENRGEEEKQPEKIKKKSEKLLKTAQVNGQKIKISQSLQPPKDIKKLKTKISTKFLQIATDQNCETQGNKSSVSLENKKSSTISTSYRRKKNEKKRKY